MEVDDLVERATEVGGVRGDAGVHEALGGELVLRRCVDGHLALDGGHAGADGLLGLLGTGLLCVDVRLEVGIALLTGEGFGRDVTLQRGIGLLTRGGFVGDILLYQILGTLRTGLLLVHVGDACRALCINVLLEGGVGLLTGLCFGCDSLLTGIFLRVDTLLQRGFGTFGTAALVGDGIAQ